MAGATVRTRNQYERGIRARVGKGGREEGGGAGAKSGRQEPTPVREIAVAETRLQDVPRRGHAGENGVKCRSPGASQELTSPHLSSGYLISPCSLTLIPSFPLSRVHVDTRIYSLPFCFSALLSIFLSSAATRSIVHRSSIAAPDPIRARVNVCVCVCIPPSMVNQ